MSAAALPRRSGEKAARARVSRGGKEKERIFGDFKIRFLLKLPDAVRVDEVRESAAYFGRS